MSNLKFLKIYSFDTEFVSLSEYFFEIKQGQCHIYSYPYEWKEYHKITNNFSGGTSKYVREISLFYEQPFENYFFFKFQNHFRS